LSFERNKNKNKKENLFPIFTTQSGFPITPCVTAITSQARPQLCNASKTHNDIFQYHIPHSEIRDAWAQIKIHLLTSGPSPANASTDPPITSTLDKIHEQLLLIQKSVSVSLNTAKPSLSYADAIKTPPPAADVPTEKFVPSRLIDEVTVKRSGNATPLLPSSASSRQSTRHGLESLANSLLPEA
jgi:hypothetical protein